MGTWDTGFLLDGGRYARLFHDGRADGLAAGRVDLVVSTVRPRRRGVVSAPLCDEELLLVAAPRVAGLLDAHLLDEHPARALQALPLLAYGEELPLVRRWWRHVVGAPPVGRAVLVAPDLRALRAAAVAGMGATVLPDYLCADAVADGSLVEVLPSGDPPINTLHLAARTSARAEPHVAGAWDALLAHARRA